MQKLVIEAVPAPSSGPCQAVHTRNGLHTARPCVLSFSEVVLPVLLSDVLGSLFCFRIQECAC